MAADQATHVTESRFGKWFLCTEIRETRVLDVALDDLDRLLANRAESYPVIVDVGCGAGQSLKRLQRRFAPDLLIGVDIDEDMLALAAAEARAIDAPVALVQGSSSSLGLAAESVDIVFCHQTFHHLPDQEGAISYPYLWWSRADLGLREKLFGPEPVESREETLMNLVAIRR